jgi:hypothetical protein
MESEGKFRSKQESGGGGVRSEPESGWGSFRISKDTVKCKGAKLVPSTFLAKM